jgi:hypothetical protein
MIQPSKHHLQIQPSSALVGGMIERPLSVIIPFGLLFGGAALLAGAIEFVTGVKVIVWLIVLSLPAFWWMRLMRQVWSLRRRHGGVHLSRLLWGMGLMAAPLPLACFKEGLEHIQWLDIAIISWGFSFCVVSLLFGALIQSLAQGMIEHAALKSDRAAGRAWLTDTLSPRRRIGPWLRGRTFAATSAWALAVTALLLIAPSMASACFAVVAVGAGFMTARAWRLPQARPTMSAALTLFDLVLPAAAASGSAATLAVLAFTDKPVYLAIYAGFGLCALAALFQAPNLWVRRDRRRWHAAWEDRLARALPDHGTHLIRQQGTAGDPTSSVTLCAALPMLNQHTFAMRARASSSDVSPITGDPTFDARFHISTDVDVARALLTAPTREAASRLHAMRLEVDSQRAVCHVPLPWQALAPAQALAALARSFSCSSQQTQADYHDARLLQSALQDPLPTARALAAQSLITRWEPSPWDQLRAHLSDDAPSLALIDALSDPSASREWAHLLQDPTPWPAHGDGFAQALWARAAHSIHIIDVHAWAAVTPPQGRLTLLDPLLTAEIAYIAREAITAAWEPWLLDALTRLSYPSQALALCQALARVGSLQSVAALRALERDAAAPARVRDAARTAVADICARVDLHDAAGTLALSTPSDSGALSITSP